jgi:hypothetical protein
VSISLRQFTSRPAPPGAWSAIEGSDHPPHGWEPVDPLPVERVAVGLDTALLRITDRAARGTSRRQFLARTGGVGLALGLGAGSVLFRADRAYAHGVSCVGQYACGPSPICSSLYCAGAECNYGRPDTARRRYAETFCSTTGTRCWLEHCCAQAYNGHAWCCDCCAPSSGADCTGSGCPNRRCICRARIDTC